MSAVGGEYGEKKVQMNQKERHKGTKWLQKKSTAFQKTTFSTA